MSVDWYRISLLESVDSKEYKEKTIGLKGEVKGKRSLSFGGEIMKRGLNITGKIKRAEFRKKGSEKELLIDTGMEKDFKIKIPVNYYGFYYNAGEPINIGGFYEGGDELSLLVDYNYNMFHKRYSRIYSLNKLLKELKNKKSNLRISSKDLKSQQHFWNSFFYFNKWLTCVGFNWKGQVWFGNRKPHLLREYRLVGGLVFSKLWDKHEDGEKFHNVWLKEKKRRLKKEEKRKQVGIFKLEKKISLSRERVKRYLKLMDMSYNVPISKLKLPNNINLFFINLNLFTFRRRVFWVFVVKLFEELTLKKKAKVLRALLNFYVKKGEK